MKDKIQSVFDRLKRVIPFITTRAGKQKTSEATVPNNKKKYFIKDISVDEIDGDFFHYNDISIVLEKILESNEPPFDIAVIGKWGLGKSSLVNLVKNTLLRTELTK